MALIKGIFLQCSFTFFFFSSSVFVALQSPRQSPAYVHCSVLVVLWMKAWAASCHFPCLYCSFKATIEKRWKEAKEEHPARFHQFVFDNIKDRGGGTLSVFSGVPQDDQSSAGFFHPERWQQTDVFNQHWLPTHYTLKACLSLTSLLIIQPELYDCVVEVVVGPTLDDFCTTGWGLFLKQLVLRL